MAVSMTGFGRCKMEAGPLTVHVEVKSVNHRFCEYHIRTPRQFLSMEDKIKKKMAGHIRRGRVEVYITLEGASAISRKVHADWDLIEEYYRVIEQVRDKFDLTGAITVQDLISKEELIHIEESESANEELEDTVLNAVEQATIQLMNMRNSEGEELLKDIASHLKQLEAYVNGLRQFAPSVILNYKERLSKKMIEFLNGQMDEARILTEVALFADKADITEELTRLSSHILQFSNILDSTETIGRKLDFLVQEMNREVNTIGSKANDPHIAVEVIEMKSLLEKMKEQIQNIE